MPSCTWPRKYDRGTKPLIPSMDSTQNQSSIYKLINQMLIYNIKQITLLDESSLGI